MDKIVKILMKRDGMTEKEAKELYQHTKSEVLDAMGEGDYNLVEDILYCDLGLEMDYIFDMM